MVTKNIRKTIACWLLLTCFFNSLTAQNVGIGTASPSALLEVAGGDAKINGLTIGRGLGNVLSNVVLGDSALSSNTSGSDNTAIGYKALFKNLSGGINVAVGRQSLYNNSVGIDNVAVGGQALFANDSGSINTAIGDWALLSNVRGSFNTAVGGSSLKSNITGRSNTAIGLSSLIYTNGDYNTAAGFNAGVSNTIGNYNTFIGAFAEGTANNLANATAIGYNAKVSGSNCFVIGGTGASAVNVGIGTPSPTALLDVVGGDAKINGVTAGRGKGNIQTNVVLGDSAMLNNTTGGDNTAIGKKAMQANTLGGANVAVGRLSLTNNRTGSNNTAVGNQALFSSDSGSVNTGIGDWAMLSNSKGNFNTALGGSALRNNTTGSSNTAVGLSSLFYSQNGNNNTGLGSNAGLSNTIGQNNTFIGASADAITGSLVNAGAIGFNAKVGGSNCFVIGGTGADAVNVGIGITIPAEKLQVNGALKLSNGNYTGIANNATAPVPTGGEGTIVFYEAHFYGWNGVAWKQLDN